LFLPLTATAWPQLAELPGWSLVFGILLLVGGFMSFIVGMLYKIVPFLAWLHLQNSGGGLAPNMNRLLPEAAMQRQVKAHALALASGWLFYNLLGAVLRYRRHLKESAQS
ncbi:MAG: hypothetical protein JNK80_03200, partial [Dechloromonas sp.]|nr:hypothetical protein [Dechloromonas sp.]